MSTVSTLLFDLIRLPFDLETSGSSVVTDDAAAAPM